VVGAELGAVFHRLADRLGNDGIAMAQQQRAMAAEVVDVAMAVDVPLVSRS
jgi:hypothetical protein